MPGPRCTLAVAPDGSWLATADGRGSVQLWDVASGAMTGVLDGHDGAVHALAAAPSGAWLASAGADGTLRVWRVPGGDPVTLVRVDGRLRSCAWGPDSRLLLAAGERGVYAYELRP
ncbi:WD40 repeat domain-containing protein [Streptomyces sp. NHF165]|uniref:WD40 repeat domain-containing protein n=1 Tax=Streptomyces sp. NHF165 TaxID=2175864 RepID=UPI003FCD3C49